MADSVTQWINRLKSGDGEAARLLWKRYADELVALARRRLPAISRGAADEDDIAQSVFNALCQGAAAGRFADLANRDELWWTLLAVTRQKVANQVRRETAQKRGAGKSRPSSDVWREDDESGRFRFEDLISNEPTPEFLAMLDEEHQRLLALLKDDQLRSIAIWRIEGYTVEEIADRLEIATRSVKRRLALIRKTWSTQVLT
jgi:RNA polymerase sigma factor (sigma-70 family)